MESKKTHYLELAIDRNSALLARHPNALFEDVIQYEKERRDLLTAGVKEIRWSDNGEDISEVEVVDFPVKGTRNGIEWTYPTLEQSAMIEGFVQNWIYEDGTVVAEVTVDLVTGVVTNLIQYDQNDVNKIMLDDKIDWITHQNFDGGLNV